MEPDPEDVSGAAIATDTEPAQTDAAQLTIEGLSPSEPLGGPDDVEAPYGRKSDGSPRQKPGRKSASAQTDDRLDSVTPAPPRVTRAPPIAHQAPIAASVDYKTLGETAATLWFNVPQPLLGAEWGPNDGEPRLIADAFTRYFKATGVNDIPPGMALVLVLTSYTMARMTKPTIKDRFILGWKWISSKIKR